jgi:hypothetical protein
MDYLVRASFRIMCTTERGASANEDRNQNEGNGDSRGGKFQHERLDFVVVRQKDSPSC